jgi:hypothetical protein
MDKQQNTEQVSESGVMESSELSLVLELKPERIQEPQTAQAQEGLGYRLSLSGTTAQPVIIELAEPKVTIHVYGQTPPIAA